MRYILRWVVSAQLDMRSLEQVSKVQYCYVREKFALISDNILETKLTRCVKAFICWLENPTFGEQHAKSEEMAQADWYTIIKA